MIVSAVCRMMVRMVMVMMMIVSAVRKMTIIGDCQDDDGGDNVLLDGCSDIFLVVALDQEHDGGGVGDTSS
jgi:hypothetical protein